MVFTREREMQLDAFLRSAERYAPYAGVQVCRASGAAFEREVHEFLRTYSRVVFQTDDDIWCRQGPPPPDDVVYSYRLGANTVYCHPLDRLQRLPTTLDRWLWRDADGDFGYPLCVNATVYYSADIVPLLDFHFYDPTALEAGLAARAHRFKPVLMGAPTHSCCVSLPHNRVSVSSGCRTGANPAWQPDALARMYLDGWRIDLDAMDFSAIVGAHQEVALAFAR